MYSSIIARTPHIYTRAHIQVLHSCTHVCSRINIRKYICTHTRTHIHAHLHIYKHAHSCIHMHAVMHAHMYTIAHTLMHTYTHCNHIIIRLCNHARTYLHVQPTHAYARTHALILCIILHLSLYQSLTVERRIEQTKATLLKQLCLDFSSTSKHQCSSSALNERNKRNKRWQRHRRGRLHPLADSTNCQKCSCQQHASSIPPVKINRQSTKQLVNSGLLQLCRFSNFPIIQETPQSEVWTSFN